MFPLLLWIIPLLAGLAYLMSCSPRSLRPTLVVFDTLVLLVVIFACFAIRPGVASDSREAAEVLQWRPYLSLVYVASLSILILTIAGVVRYLIFRTRG
jgi:hypothetical protein